MAAMCSFFNVYVHHEREEKIMEFSNKKKIGIITLAALAGISIIGSSVAYFTSTDTKNNPFTGGSVRTILHAFSYTHLDVYKRQQ